MKYRDGEYAPNIGDLVDVYCENFPPERARVMFVGRKKIKIKYENAGGPASEYIQACDCDLISREG